MKRKKGKFYIYGHYTADTGKLFYIGKGAGYRAWSSKAQRAKQNPHWANVVKKHGYVVKLIEENLTEKQAFRRERELIAEVGLENLTNVISGGIGPTSAESHAIAKERGALRYSGKVQLISPTGVIYEDYNITELCRTHNLNRGTLQRTLRGERKQHKGWKRYIPPTDIHKEFFTF